MDNIDVRFKSIYYESTESKNINFIRDATEMAKSGYNIYNVAAIERDAKDSLGHLYIKVLRLHLKNNSVKIY